MSSIDTVRMSRSGKLSFCPAIATVSSTARVQNAGHSYEWQAACVMLRNTECQYALLIKTMGGYIVERNNQTVATIHCTLHLISDPGPDFAQIKPEPHFTFIEHRPCTKLECLQPYL